MTVCLWYFDLCQAGQTDLKACSDGLGSLHSQLVQLMPLCSRLKAHWVAPPPAEDTPVYYITQKMWLTEFVQL